MKNVPSVFTHSIYPWVPRYMAKGTIIKKSSVAEASTYALIDPPPLPLRKLWVYDLIIGRPKPPPTLVFFRWVCFSNWKVQTSN